MKKQLAEDKGAIPKGNPQEEAKALAEEGKHIKEVPARDFEYKAEWDDNPTLEDETE